MSGKEGKDMDEFSARERDFAIKRIGYSVEYPVRLVLLAQYIKVQIIIQ